MKARKLTPLFCLLSLVFLASCMPDSLSKFEEDSPVKERAVDNGSSGGGSNTPAPAPVPDGEGTISSVTINQQQGDKIILKVDSFENFNVGDSINVSSNIATAVGTTAVGTIISITQEAASSASTDGDIVMIVQLGVAAALPNLYFLPGYYIDNCSTGYATCAANNVGGAEVIRWGFYVGPNDTFSKRFTNVLSSTTMDLNYSVSPSFPNGVSIDGMTAGNNTDDAILSPRTPFKLSTTDIPSDDYTITVSVKNFGATLDSNETASVSFYITGTVPGTPVGSAVGNPNGVMAPTGASIAKYQFIRLDSNASRFFRGSRVSVNTADDTSNIVGRVLLTDDSDGLLVEATGDIAPGYGLDNTGNFFSNEAVVKDYQYWYVSNATGFDVADTVTSDSSMAVINAVDTANNRLYVMIQTGSFTEGDTITEDDPTSLSTTILSRETRSYVTGVLEVADVSNFTIGGPVSTASNDLAYVVSKDATKNHLYIAHIRGGFSDSENIDNVTTFVATETTISGIVGPITSLGIAGGSNTSSGVDFREGSLVSSSAGATQRGTGYAVAGTDTALNTLVVQMEHFDDGKWIDVADNLDDYTVTNIGLGSPYTVSSATLSNLIVSYVGESVHLEPFVVGSFAGVTISPDLPAGLVFNNTTGAITGTPTEPSTVKNYTLTFTYPAVSNITYTFPLVVYNQFEITQKNAAASSYLLHKEGRGLAGAKCKVFGPQVVDDDTDPLYGSSVYGFNDVVCRLEGGEQDLFKEGMNLNINSGAGMCEFVRYKPFSYQGVPEGSTDAVYVRYAEFSQASACAAMSTTSTTTYIDATELENNARPTATRAFGSTYCVAGSSCIADDTITATPGSNGLCQFKHSDITNNVFNYPNSDLGNYYIITVSCTENATACNCSESIEFVECGGTTRANIAGPIHDAGINPQTFTEDIYPSFNSLNRDLVINSPLSKSLTENYYLANYTSQNACYGATTYHVENSVALGASSFNDTWEGFGNLNDPFGGASSNQFYTFECLNASGDIKARIRMQVRDWDRNFTPESSEVELLAPGSPMDDATASCFGSNCNNYNDYDDNNGTNFTTCAETQALTVSATTVDIIAGNDIITANTGTFDANNFRRGTLLKVGPGQELTFVVEEYISSTSIRVTVPSPQLGSNLAVRFYDGYRYPLEGFPGGDSE